eukprot:1160116-Pelagomonas_calceolata.AAC.5
MALVTTCASFQEDGSSALPKDSSGNKGKHAYAIGHSHTQTTFPTTAAAEQKKLFLCQVARYQALATQAHIRTHGQVALLLGLLGCLLYFILNFTLEVLGMPLVLAAIAMLSIRSLPQDIWQAPLHACETPQRDCNDPPQRSHASNKVSHFKTGSPASAPSFPSSSSSSSSSSSELACPRGFFLDLRFCCCGCRCMQGQSQRNDKPKHPNISHLVTGNTDTRQHKENHWHTHTHAHTHTHTHTHTHAITHAQASAHTAVKEAKQHNHTENEVDGKDSMHEHRQLFP